MEINDLKRERANLQARIKDWYDKGKNAKELVYKFHEISDELIRKGVNVTYRAEYFNLDFWDKFEGKQPTKEVKSTPQPNIIQEEPKPIKPNQDSYILCLAWTASLQNETPEQVTKVQDYFNELGLPLLDEEVGEIDNRMEHVLRYEFKGSEESFRLLKMCTQFVLDAFAKTDFEKFNIAIFGKKKKF